MGYGIVARLFHWVTVLLVLVMIPVGLTMTQDCPQPLQDRLFILHKGLGPVVLLVVRAAARLAGVQPAAAAAGGHPAAAARGGGGGARRGSTLCCWSWRSAAMSG